MSHGVSLLPSMSTTSLRLAGHGRGSAARRLCLLFTSVTLLSGMVPVWAEAESENIHPARPGLIVIEAAADSAADFRWLDLPAVGTRCLVWDSGILNLQAGQEMGRYGVADLTLPYSLDLTGISEGRLLIFEAGRYEINQPLLLADKGVQLFLTRGEIEIETDRLVYRQTQPPTDPRAQYMLIAGIVILITILMFRARSRLREQ